LESLLEPYERLWLCENRKSKVGVVSRVISSTESESEESEHFLTSDSVYYSVVCDPVKIGLAELEAEVEEPTSHKVQN